MRRSASEVIRNLERRIARLENRSAMDWTDHMLEHESYGSRYDDDSVSLREVSDLIEDELGIEYYDLDDDLLVRKEGKRGGEYYLIPDPNSDRCVIMVDGDGRLEEEVDFLPVSDTRSCTRQFNRLTKGKELPVRL